MSIWTHAFWCPVCGGKTELRRDPEELHRVNAHCMTDGCRTFFCVAERARPQDEDEGDAPPKRARKQHA